MTTDKTMPDGKWAFDERVTEAFDDMLERSIPAYNTMRDLTTSLAVAHLKPDTALVDLGCSRGQAIGHVVDRLARFDRAQSAGVRFVGVDVSEPMIAAARQRFAHDPRVQIGPCDLRTSYPDVQASVTMAILTVQFTPVEYRWRLMQEMFDHTVPGGAVLLVEKVLGASSALHDLFDAEYLSMKSAHGYSDEAILRKKASLEGVLVSQTAAMNQHMLERVGFRFVDTYWRWLNFAGWVAVR